MTRIRIRVAAFLVAALLAVPIATAPAHAEDGALVPEYAPEDVTPAPATPEEPQPDPGIVPEEPQPPI